MKKTKKNSKISYNRYETRTRWKIYLATLFLTGIFCAIGYKSLELQVLNRDKAFKLAEKQHNTTYNLLPIRGNIYDKNQRYLATNLNTKSIYLNPKKIEEKEKFAKKISKPLKISYKKALSMAISKKSFVWLERLATKETVEKVKELDLEGVDFIDEPKRFYPNSHLMGQVIGFTNIDLKGIEGLEYHYDGILSGKPRKITTRRDARGNHILDIPVDIVESTKGNDLVLTIDSQIQHIVENELKKGIKKTGAKSGMALLMDPETGEILAMASYPFFDPNKINKFPEINRRNLPIWYSFEPGSTLKVFLVAALLEEKLANVNTMYDCENGRRKVGPKVIKDTHPHGVITVSKAIEVSSNICASKIGENIGKKNLNNYLRNFGFGGKVGVDLPGESNGSIQKLSKWGPVELATISFGQGISVTAIQMVTALSSIANGGYLMKPYMVKQVINPSGKLIHEKKPEVLSRVISYDTALKVAKIMEGVVENGSGKNAQIKGYRVAGKTGTAQIPNPSTGGYYANKYRTSFMGFAPVDDPKLSLIVLLEDPKKEKYGSTAAAPVFKSIAEKVLFYMDIPTNEEFNGNVIMPNLDGKSARDVLRWAQEEGIENQGVEIKFEGSGYVYSQSPSPGTILNKGTKCIFNLRQDI